MEKMEKAVSVASFWATTKKSLLWQIGRIAADIDQLTQEARDVSGQELHLDRVAGKVGFTTRGGNVNVWLFDSPDRAGLIIENVTEDTRTSWTQESEHLPLTLREAQYIEGMLSVVTADTVKEKINELLLTEV